MKRKALIGVILALTLTSCGEKEVEENVSSKESSVIEAETQISLEQLKSMATDSLIIKIAYIRMLK